MPVSRLKSKTSTAFFTTDITLGGGISSVGRSFALAKSGEDEPHSGYPVNTHALHDPPGTHFLFDSLPTKGYGGARLRFTLRLIKEYMNRRSELVLGHLAFARPLGALPVLRAYTVWVYGIETDRIAKSPLIRRGLRRAARLVAISHWTRDMVLRELPELENKISIIHPCIEPQRERLWDNQQAQDLETYSRKEPTALIVGRMPSHQPGKGHETLIRIWGEVRKTVPDAQLLIVGDGNDRGRLESLTNSIKPGGVKFTGRVDDSELGHLYATSDVFVMPSVQDGFGIVYAEAMWHGLPCIAGRGVGGADSIVRHGDTGLLVSPSDVKELACTISRCLTDFDLHDRMSKRAKSTARAEFTFSRFRQDVKAISRL